jgi:hypothetical protein
MKKQFKLLFFLAVLTWLSAISIEACTIEIYSLKKRFRQANTVFIGKVTKIVDYQPSAKELSLMPKEFRDWKGFSKVTFEVSKTWKGSASSNQEFIGVSAYICGCDIAPRVLKEGEEFLVFSPKKNFVSVCDVGETKKDYVKDEIKSLNKFSFRFWASIYPF